MIKILAIGNSFSQDATAFMELLSSTIFVRNLYIGGCSLEKHAELLDASAGEYEYQHNGQRCLPNNVTLKEALTFEKWDYITVQQSSGCSGLEETYYPHIEKLIAYVKKYSKAEILFHQTWAYEKRANHPDYEKYRNDHDIMWKSIRETSRNVCQKMGLRMIPTGEMIESLKADPFFDIDKGGISIHADGYHLSGNYGRFAAACVWLKFFTGEVPNYLDREDVTEGYRLIRRALK